MGRTIRIVTLLLCGIFMAACFQPEKFLPTKGEETSGPSLQVLENKSSTSMEIGMLVNNLTSEVNLALVEAATSKANELNLELRVYNGNNDSQIQSSQLEKLVEEGIGGIILVTQQPDLLQHAVGQAGKAGVPVVCLGARVEGEGTTAFVGAPEEYSGELAMEFAAGIVQGKGKIVILEGSSGQSLHLERRKGIQTILEKNRGIRVLSAKNGNWTAAAAMTLMERWLQAFDEIDAVVAENDDMALGARWVIEQHGLNIPVVAIDGTAQGVEAVAQNRLAATVFQNIPKQAEIAVEVVYSAMEQETIAPEYWTDCLLVQPENVQEIGNFK